MHCPFCYYEDTRVIDSRLTEEGTMVRRRRECPCCDERFNTFETVELKLPMIIKSDKRREPFNKQKLRTSFERALQKRPVTSNALDKAMHEIIDALYRSSEREVSSRQVGERVMHTLKQLDQVAYVRFASVYRKFEDVRAFRHEIENLERELPWLET